MAIFKGAAVAIVTPMYQDGSVNYDEFRKLIEFQIENGTDAIVVCGTTGEASTLSHEEHLDVIKYCAEVVNKRIPVIAGTGSNSTETAIYLSTEAEKYGVDGLLLVTPYYNKATQNGLYAHFKAVADSVKLPIILYNVPGRTGCSPLRKFDRVIYLLYLIIASAKRIFVCLGKLCETDFFKLSYSFHFLVSFNNIRHSRSRESRGYQKRA